MMKATRWILGGALVLLQMACSEPEPPPEPNTIPIAEMMKLRREGLAKSKQMKAEKTAPRKGAPAMDMTSRLAKFAPTKIDFDEALVTPPLRPVFKKLVEAATVMDEIYLLQVAEENPAWREKLAKAPALAGQLAYFDIMFGPWDRLDQNRPFLDVGPKAPGATFYPKDMTKEEFLAHVAANPGDQAAFEGYFTLIRRGEDRKLKAVPYSEAYKLQLDRAAALLREAAGLSKDKRLATFLNGRADAFASNDYRPSDRAWMDLGDGDVEVVIGPYEVYEDALFGYKAAFEAFVCLRDPEESAKLAKIARFIPELEKNLPMPDDLKKPRKGQESPISVVYELYAGGNARAGVQTLAFNLPNDEVVRQEKGSKKVMLKNVAHAKFEKILMPIAGRMMVVEQVGDVTFNAFFNHTLMHETSHGLGPGIITVAGGVETDVNKVLKDLYPPIEEAKADILGLWTTTYLIRKKVYPETFMNQVYATFLGGFFRSVRFGAHEAHGKANAIQFNYLLDKGAIEKTAEGQYRILVDKAAEAVASLATELLVIEAKGDYAGAKALIDKYGTLPQDLVDKLASLKDIPVDIRPEYPVLEKMAAW